MRRDVANVIQKYKIIEYQNIILKPNYVFRYIGEMIRYSNIFRNIFLFITSAMH